MKHRRRNDRYDRVTGKGQGVPGVSVHLSMPYIAVRYSIDGWCRYRNGTRGTSRGGHAAFSCAHPAQCPISKKRSQESRQREREERKHRQSYIHRLRGVPRQATRAEIEGGDANEFTHICIARRSTCTQHFWCRHTQPAPGADAVVSHLDVLHNLATVILY